MPIGGRGGFPASLYALFLPLPASLVQFLHSGRKYLSPPVLVDWFLPKNSSVSGNVLLHLEQVRVVQVVMGECLTNSILTKKGVNKPPKY